jgi:hypothetical protein
VSARAAGPSRGVFPLFAASVFCAGASCAAGTTPRAATNIRAVNRRAMRAGMKLLSARALGADPFLERRLLLCRRQDRVKTAFREDAPQLVLKRPVVRRRRMARRYELDVNHLMAKRSPDVRVGILQRGLDQDDPAVCHAVQPVVADVEPVEIRTPHDLDVGQLSAEMQGVQLVEQQVELWIRRLVTRGLQHRLFRRCRLRIPWRVEGTGRETQQASDPDGQQPAAPMPAGSSSPTSSSSS